jgi:mRNA interferase MazF
MESHLMIKYSIVLVPFPFDDFSELKVRPAICLTNPTGKFDHIIIAFISSNMPSELLESDLTITKDSEHFAGTGLLVDSVIRLNKMVTIHKKLIKRKLGSINKSLENILKFKIKKLFELS